MTFKEIADKLRVHPKTVKRWLKQGRISGKLEKRKRGGYNWVIDDEWISKLINGRIKY